MKHNINSRKSAPQTAIGNYQAVRKQINQMPLHASKDIKGVNQEITDRDQNITEAITED